MPNEHRFMSNVAISAKPTAPDHAVTKEWVEGIVAGTMWGPVNAATAGALPGVTASAQNLTGASNGQLTSIDGVAPSLGDRILVKNQADKSQNGIYEVAALGDASSPFVLARAGDADESGEFRPGKTVYAMPGGALHGDETFRLAVSSSDVITVGVTAFEFTVASGTDYAKVETAHITGNGSLSEFTVTHTLNTTAVIVQTWRRLDRRQVTFGVEIVSASSVRLSCSPALPQDEIYDVHICALPVPA